MKIDFAGVLENERVLLKRLQFSHLTFLEQVAYEDDTLLQYSPSEINTRQKLENYVNIALRGYESGTRYPYLVFDKIKQSYAGCTSYGNYSADHKRVEIGWTWIGRTFQGTDLNRNMKFLMLDYAFDHLNLNRVEFKIDERNLASRKAVEKIGGILEGILRKHTILTDGFIRNTCCYAILKEEWKGLTEGVFNDLIPRNEMKL